MDKGPSQGCGVDKIALSEPHSCGVRTELEPRWRHTRLRELLSASMMSTNETVFPDIRLSTTIQLHSS